MRRMDLGGLDVVDLGADDVVGFANDYDDGTGLGISIGGIFRGIKKGVTAPFKLGAKGVKAVGKGAFKVGKFVAKRPYLLAPVALAIPGVAPAAFGALKFGAKAGAKVVKAPFKLAGKVFGRKRPPSQAMQEAQARQRAEKERLQREREELRRMRPQIAPISETVADVVADETKTREEKRAGLKELLGKIGGEILARDATGAALPEGVTPPAAAGVPSAPESPEEAAAAGEGAPTLAGLFQGPAFPLLAGVAALMLFGGKGGGGRRRRRNPPRRRRRRR